jgi:hypothetical protein
MNAADNMTTIATQVSVFLKSAHDQAKDGLSWAEFGRLLVELLHLLVSSLDAVSSLSGPEKKQIALTAVLALFDQFADRCVPLAVYPAWLLVRPGARLLILSLSAGAIEALLSLVRTSQT